MSGHAISNRVAVAEQCSIPIHEESIHLAGGELLQRVEFSRRNLKLCHSRLRRLNRYREDLQPLI